MGFRSGSISYARFRVVGGPDELRTDLIAQLASGAMGPPPPGGPPEVSAGWTAGGHVLDVEFDAERNVFGDALLFGLRQDVNRVPADVRKAYRALAERAKAAEFAGGHVSMLGRGARREAREEADDRCRQELAEGRHRRSRHIEVLWNVARREVLCPAFSDAMVGSLRDLFRDTFDAALVPLTSGGLARERLESVGRSRDFEDLQPTPFTKPPERAEAEGGRDLARPLVPWALSGGGEEQDFIGNEFITWLWWRVAQDEGAIDAADGHYEVAIDRRLDMQCAWDVTGKQALRGHAPHRLPEAADALRGGKWPRSVGLLFAAGDEFAECALQGDRFVVSGLKMPRPEEPPATEAEATEGRLASLDTIDRALVGLFRSFLEVRTSSSWASVRQSMVEWMRAPGGRAAPVRTMPAPVRPEGAGRGSDATSSAGDASPDASSDASTPVESSNGVSSVRRDPAPAAASARTAGAGAGAGTGAEADSADDAASASTDDTAAAVAVADPAKETA